ncbi:MAG: hypothetical protein LBV54_00130 [Puniceicoccales bacterium]|nr:hypothetical protein [Puniceicoccales bacterium]
MFALFPSTVFLLSGCVSQYSLLSAGNSYGTSYSVVVSKNTYAEKSWRAVADALVSKHGAQLVFYEGGVAGAREVLTATMPRYTAFVARPEECGQDYIADIHLLVRQLDEDPWEDTQWGIITGNDAAGALRIALVSAPHEIKKTQLGALTEKRGKSAQDLTPVAICNFPACALVNAAQRPHAAEGINQIAAYADATSLGRSSKGMLDIWQTLPGRNSFSESFFLNQQWMLHELAGLRQEVDASAFYGDPAWRVTLDSPEEPAFVSTGLMSAGSEHTFRIEINNRMMAAQNTTPIGTLFTMRLKNVKIISGWEYEPVVADNFILLFKPVPQGQEKEIVVKFSGEPVREK